MNPKTVVIKKYGNRRLYDSTNSRYVNLDEVAQMVREGRNLQVVDATSGEDLTRAVLSQIVIEQAKSDDTAFPLDVLRQMVAATGRATSEAALTYMNTALNLYQNAYRAVSLTPEPRPDPPSSPTVSANEVDDLKKRISELESLVRDIKPVATPKAARTKKRR